VGGLGISVAPSRESFVTQKPEEVIGGFGKALQNPMVAGALDSVFADPESLTDMVENCPGVENCPVENCAFDEDMRENSPRRTKDLAMGGETNSGGICQQMFGDPGNETGHKI
jgi:hypothetical protein